MSARPRPVTATFLPNEMRNVPVGVRSRSYSLSSGGSTESLLSVLDHDSVENLTDEDEQEPERNGTFLVEEQKPVPEKPRKPRQINDIRSRSVNSNLSTDGEISAWEQWLLTKVKEERQVQKQEKQRKNKQDKQQEQQAKEELKRKSEEKFKEWLQKKSEEDEKLIATQQQNKLKKELEEAKKKEVEEKAKAKYEEWLSKKQLERQCLKEQQKLQEQQKQQLKVERQSKSEQAYQGWKEKVQHRPVTPRVSFGYSEGKLTGYYDVGAYPQPTYFNPVPWCPPEIPVQKKKKPPSALPRRKYVWQPDKYR